MHVRKNWIRAGLGTILLLAATVPAAAQDLPTADDLIEKYIEAVGGEEVIRATPSTRTKGVMEMASMGMSGDMEIVAKAPNKMLMKMELPNVGTITSGFNGTVGWIDNPMTGAMLMEGDQLKDISRQADVFSDLRYADNYPTRETVEKTEFAGEPAYKVRLVDTDDKELFEYFSVESGLKIGFEGEQTNEMGTVFVSTVLGDFQDIEGRIVPMTTTATMMGMEMKIKIEDISFEDVDDSTFELPENIKVLAEKAKG